MKDVYINPYRFKEEDLPLVALSDHTSGFVQWIIKWRTKGNYNHGMGMVWPGEFVSQGNIFSAVPLDRYMTKNSRLKFYGYKNLTEDKKALIRERIFRRLNKKRHWWQILGDYDWLGIFGQAIGIQNVNNPLKTFCIEQVIEDMLDGIIALEYEFEGKTCRLPRHANPAQLNEFLRNHPEMYLKGRWSAD